MARAVVRHPQPLHEDFAIVSIHSLPVNVLQFGVVHEVVQEFLEEHIDVRIQDIQPTIGTSWSNLCMLMIGTSW
jgi:hypothetical protein